MTEIKPPILAAISAAVGAYLEEEAACLAAAALPGVPGPPPPPLNLWALSGRQAAMQMRALMQRRSFR
ncbi:MAG: hypothetical protein FJ128_06130 [Deltaproteobacteria bacterium]|nr:hypothetical protein [Deltaproteobacteria bacterium]